MPVKSGLPQKRQAVPAESGGPIAIDFKNHAHLGWTHYRTLLGVQDHRKRRFYFEQTAHERWSTRELQRKIDGALFERIALSRDTKKLVALEKKKGQPEVVRYEDIFKDPYLLDFLGLKGAYLEKDNEKESGVKRSKCQYFTSVPYILLKHIQELADKNFEIIKVNSQHPSLPRDLQNEPDSY